MELKEAIQTRKSIRAFSDKPLTDYELKLIYWAAYKVPSAGALYPLCLYIELRVDGSTMFFICADFKKTTIKYGERGIRYVYMEAGHMAQNIQLMATEMGLGSYCIGAFDEEAVQQRLECKEIPIYLVHVGNKKE